MSPAVPSKRVLVPAVLAAAVVAAVLAVDVVAESALESALERVSGTGASVEDLDVGILSGTSELRGLRLDAPEGFESPHLLSLSRGRLEVGLASLLADTVQVEELRLQGVDLRLEVRGGESNFAPLLDRLAGWSPEEGGRRYRVERVVVSDVTADVRAGAAGASVARGTVEVPEIRLRNVGSGGGVPLARLAGIVLQATLEAVARRSGDVPGSVRGLLRRGLGALPGGVELRLPGGEGEGGDGGLGDRLQRQAEELLPGGGGDGGT